MSRIDEALRRARSHQRSDGREGAATEAGTITAPVVPSWQYERFPLESQVRTDRGAASRRTVQSITVSGAARPSQAPAAATRESVGVRYTPGGVSPLFKEKIVGAENAAASREQYGRVAARLHQAQRQDRLRLVMVTSAVPGEGKTLTAANVALTLSTSYGRRVLLVDADLRRPTLHELFQVSNAQGLLDGLEAGTDAPMPLIEVSPTLSVLPAGRSIAEPMSLLISDRMRQVLHEAAEAFDWVIVDTPPIGLVPDAHVLADMVPAAVFVVRAGSTPHDLVTAAVTTLGRERILGVVLNCVADAEVVGAPERYAYGDVRGAE